MRRPLALGLVAVGAACTLPTSAPPDDPPLSAPVNSCTDHPCSSYVQSGVTPSCNGGVCVVVTTQSNVVLLVSLSEDSYFAPGQTFAISFDHLFDPPGNDKCALGGTAIEPRPCTHLPGYGTVNGVYLAQPSDAQTLNWNLGNTVLTALPVHVTYRPLWTPPGAGAPVDAESLGLPLGPIPSSVVVDNSPNRAPGPNGGESITFFAELQPDALYERVVAPDPPFDAAFPPDVSQVTVSAGSIDDTDHLAWDLTTSAQGQPVIPTFDISRVEGLTGWTAYLRDATTKRTLSPVAPLSGAKSTVVLPTNHHPTDPQRNAVTGTELVVAPPAGKTIPTGKFSPTAGVLPRAETYPSLAAPVSMSGSVTGADGSTPVEADLVFEATGIYELGASLPNTSNYEYTARASARIDAASGASVWSVVLPPGQYNVTARPLSPGQGVTVVPSFDVPPSDSAVDGGTIEVAPQQPVTGVAALSDGRALSGATVTALPAQCAVGTSDACLPQYAQTTTAPDGSFALLLDQGTYTLRIAPPDGTGFGWLVQTVLVGPSPVALAPSVVTVPARVSLVLHDSLDNAIIGAVVRVFQIPAKGPAVELGRAMTDSSGFYDMFLTPRTQ